MLPLDKLEAIERRFQEIEQLLCDPAVVTDHEALRKLNKERSDIEPVVTAFGRFRSVEQSIADDRAALDDPELKELAEMELAEHEAERDAIAADLKVLSAPERPQRRAQHYR